MNYIKRLERDLRRAERWVRAYDMRDRDVRAYLQSSKFHEDPTVQVRDIEQRLFPTTVGAYFDMLTEQEQK